MIEEKEPTPQQAQEMKELLASVNDDGYFAKRKYPSTYEAISNFLFSAFMLGFLSAVLFLYGHVEVIGFRLLLFCFAPSVIFGAVKYRYVMGVAPSTAMFLLFAAISWFAFYGPSVLNV